MSELAFNLNGEPFELPSAAVGWRVRKMKPKGAPEVVYSRDGIPLILPIDADIDDLRRAARSEGRFRLDPVDEHNRMIANASAGYVCVPADENPPGPVPTASRVQTDNVAIEAMKLNTELARSIVDKFPMMIESAAALLRAADSAGITTRPPRVLAEETSEDDDEVEDDDEDDQDVTPGNEAAPKASGLVGLFETLAPLVMPAIMNAIAGGKLKIPGGIGALLDCRRARPKARSHADASTAHAMSTPGAGPVPGPRDPAPARTAGTSMPTAGRRGPAGGSGFAQAYPAGARAGTAVLRRPAAAAAPAPSSSAPGPRTQNSPASNAVPTSHPAAARPVSDAAPASFVAAPAPTAAAPQATAPIHPHDLRFAAGASGQVSETPAGQPPNAGALTSHVTHRNEAPVELDVSADGRLQIIPGADRPESGADPADETHDDANADGMLPADDEPATEANAEDEDEDELPTLDAAALAHFAAIQSALTFREGMLARELAAELAPAELRAWMTELCELSVTDAVAKIRAVLNAAGDDNPSGGES